MNPEDILQDRLDRLQAGGTLDTSLANLSQDEADLLKIASMLQSIPVPDREPARVAQDRAALLRAAQARAAATSRSAHRAWTAAKSFWTAFATRLASARRPAALALAGALLIVAAAGIVLSRPQLPDPTAPGALSAQLPSTAPTTLPYTQYMPMMSRPLAAPNPQSAVLSAARGVVQVQTGGESWTVLKPGNVVVSGQRVRTGALSSATLLFYDGSQARLGPASELSIDELDAQADGPRIVQLTQSAGDSDHEVSPSAVTGSRYEVRTPSGTGVAKGTAFHVQVAPNRIARFNVDEGAVSVTHLNVTVIVIAGKSTTVYPDEPPAPPVFRISGQGELTAMGDVWTIGGRDFLVNTALGPDNSTTEIVGDPRIGDWVSVEGRILPDGSYFADRIVLLRRAAENRFTFSGIVDAIGPDEWTIAGRTVAVTGDTEIDTGIAVGSQVEVSGTIGEDGSLRAERIRLISDANLPFEFTGVVEGVGNETWTISGVQVAVDENTESQGDPQVGDVVKVEGHILADGTWLATEIKLVEARLGEFEYTGTVDSIDPWVVSGIAVDTDEQTKIDEGIAVGDRVRVEGRVLSDGSWLATEIRRLDDVAPHRFEIVGRVSSKDPWIVGGITLSVTETTHVDEGIEVGDTVRASGIILPDGTFAAERITRLRDGLGCLNLTAIVISISGNRVVLSNGQTIELGDDVSIDGQLAVNAVIIVRICVNRDGSVVVVSIVVIFQPQPPTPPVPPGGDDDDDDGDNSRVTICHKPDKKDGGQTLSIPRSALGGHLGHGDTLGPCSGGEHDDHDD